MTPTEQALRNRLTLEQQAQIRHDDRFDRMYRRERYSMLLILAVLVSGAFFLSMDVIASLDEGAKPGKIYAKSEMTKSEVKALNIMPMQGEKQ